MVKAMVDPRLKSGYEIEWHPSCPTDECGGLDIDRCEYEFELFATLDEARKRAKVVLEDDVFGSVLIRDFFWQEYDDDGIPFFDYENGQFLEEVYE